MWSHWLFIASIGTGRGLIVVPESLYNLFGQILFLTSVFRTKEIENSEFSWTWDIDVGRGVDVTPYFLESSSKDGGS